MRVGLGCIVATSVTTCGAVIATAAAAMGSVTAPLQISARDAMPTRHARQAPNTVYQNIWMRAIRQVG